MGSSLARASRPVGVEYTPGRIGGGSGCGGGFRRLGLWVAPSPSFYFVDFVSFARRRRFVSRTEVWADEIGEFVAKVWV